MRWFQGLRAPRLQLPMAAFGVVGVTYYAQLGVVLYRAYRNNDRHVRRRALMVLVGNELWNVAFFGRCSPGNGLLGVLLLIWVIGYDVPWIYRLWRLNQG